jgi:hypothetical protein
MSLEFLVSNVKNVKPLNDIPKCGENQEYIIIPFSLFLKTRVSSIDC